MEWVFPVNKQCGTYVVRKWPFDRVKVVRADRNERAATANVLVELVLQVNEAVYVWQIPIRVSMRHCALAMDG